MYDKDTYDRRKKGTMKKTMNPNTPEGYAFGKIRKKWGFSDHRIRKLLDTHTVSEILGGRMKGNEFIPKEIVRMKVYEMLALIALVIAGISAYRLTFPAPIIAIVSNNVEITGDCILK